jgi:CRP-like cAMP-binding protein
VHQDGREIARLGPLESFGEVGLLQNGPRTATVRAQGAGRLLALDSESFIAAVTGHRDTDTVAHDRVAGYLARDRSRRDLGR